MSFEDEITERVCERLEPMIKKELAELKQLLSGYIEERPNDFLSAKEVAEKLSVTTRTVDRMVASGRLPAPEYIGGLKRWKARSITEARRYAK